MSDVSPAPAVWPAVRAALAKFSRPFPAEALALADAHREEVVPHLVAELESLAANPEQVDAEDMLVVYAMHLLAWWREPRGLEPLLALARLRDHKHVDALFGDLLADGLGPCLGSMARGHLQPLMALADDPHAEPYARGAALDAMKACVIEGDAPREAVLAYVRDLAERVAAEGRASDDEFLILSFVVSLAADLGAADMLPAIRGWYDEGLLDPVLAGLPDIESVISQPPEQRLQELREQGAGYMRDPSTEMAGWYCFKEPPSPSPTRPEAQAMNPPPPRPAVASSPPAGSNSRARIAQAGSQ